MIAYRSRKLNKAECNYSTIEREALGAVAAIKEFFPYLYGRWFTLLMDHNPLMSLRGLKDTVPKPQAPLGTLSSDYPFQKLSWDILGPLPTTLNGNQYILVVTDLFSKWVEAFSLAKTDSTTFAAVLTEEIVGKFGVPEAIHSDQGPNFVSGVIQS
ncbi:hypothetical protein EMCRGX_G005657 [Ephydatia muelleri]